MNKYFYGHDGKSYKVNEHGYNEVMIATEELVKAREIWIYESDRIFVKSTFLTASVIPVWFIISILVFVAAYYIDFDLAYIFAVLLCLMGLVVADTIMRQIKQWHGNKAKAIDKDWAEALTSSGLSDDQSPLRTLVTEREFSDNLL